MRGPNNAASSSTSKGGGAMAAFKQDLLRNLLLGLRARTAEAACPFDAMSLQERKRAVKCSADVAMAAAAPRRASATGGRARWPKAILAAAAAASSSSHSPSGTCKVRKSACKCKRVARRRVDAKRIRGYAAASCDVARRLVRRRTMALRKVIPGGNAAMDDAALLRETMDYVVHLRAQVDVLRRISAAVQISTSLRDPSQSMAQL
ncbi:transcription factor IBH1-like 1 [Miscanthus floridulus]|uniref:transcription factor IBH1-like 1 n=1 Tax=Miscanthus floridulus TaxID=154761 RepID=UPI003459E3E4